MDVDTMRERVTDAAHLLAAMANEKRLMILCLLVDNEYTVTELAGQIGLAQSPLSQHLAKLRAQSLVNTRRDGQSIYYSLASGPGSRVLELLNEIYCKP